MTTVFFALFPLATLSLVLLGLHLGSRRARLPRSAALPAGLAAAGWLLAVATLERSGVTGRFDRLPPPLFLCALSGVAVGLLLLRHRAVRAALDAMPAAWLVGFQGFRAPLELGLWALYLEGRLPRQMTFEGSNLDLLAGLTAPLVAWLLARRANAVGLALAWQLLGIGLLLNVLRVALTSAPGPLRGDWPGEPLTVVATAPFVLVPTVLVPLAALAHLAGVRALRRSAGGFQLPRTSPAASRTAASP